MSATPELTRRITGLASGGVLTIVPVATGVAHVSASGLYVDQDIAEEILRGAQGRDLPHQPKGKATP